MGDHLSASDWHTWARDGESKDPFQAFQRQRSEERRDYSAIRLAWVEGRVDNLSNPDFSLECGTDSFSYLRLRASVSRPPPVLDLNGTEAKPDGLLRYRPVDE
jgi:hypothetical protein